MHYQRDIYKMNYQSFVLCSSPTAIAQDRLSREPSTSRLGSKLNRAERKLRKTYLKGSRLNKAEGLEAKKK